MQKLPPNVHDAINGAVRREVPRAVERNIPIIAKAVTEEIGEADNGFFPAYEAQATNVSVTTVPQGAAVPFNTLVLDSARDEVFRNPDGSFSVRRGVWLVAWNVFDATTAGLVVDSVVVSRGVAGETDLIEIKNKTATVKVVAVTGDITLQDAPATQASISFVRLASPHRHRHRILDEESPV